MCFSYSGSCDKDGYHPLYCSDDHKIAGKTDNSRRAVARNDTGMFAFGDETRPSAFSISAHG